mmetsp:Transcript_22043/g.41305  ORF Transcript_22043/g.41305 Transcript_22043/m.41305 type:complete len:288 (-) Transcript_22043:36-899(-)
MSGEAFFLGLSILVWLAASANVVHQGRTESNLPITISRQEKTEQHDDHLIIRGKPEASSHVPPESVIEFEKRLEAQIARLPATGKQRPNKTAALVAQIGMMAEPEAIPDTDDVVAPDVFAEHLRNNIQRLKGHAGGHAGTKSRAMRFKTTDAESSADSNEKAGETVESFALKIKNSIVSVQNEALDELEAMDEARWKSVTQLQNENNGKFPRFAHRTREHEDEAIGQGKAPAWYQNPGPWWLPASAAKPADVAWAKKYKDFITPPEGVLPVYVPFPNHYAPPVSYPS